MDIDFNQITIVPAEKENEKHKMGLWEVYNENIGINLITSEPITYEEHSKWWAGVFEKEYIFVIIYHSIVSGYIRLTKIEIGSKKKHEISIAIKKKFHNTGFGTKAYEKWESLVKELGVKKIHALTMSNNKLGQNFFAKNNFKRVSIRFEKEL